MPVTLLQRLTGSYAVIYLRGNKVAVFWIGVLAAIWAIAALAPVVATHDPLRQSADLLEGGTCSAGSCTADAYRYLSG